MKKQAEDFKLQATLT